MAKRTTEYPYMPASVNVERIPSNLDTMTGLPNDSEDQVLKISADNVMTTNARQFITAEERNVLSTMLDTVTNTAKHVMYKEQYDRDNDNIVDIAKKSLITDTVLWENVIGRPNIPIETIEKVSEDAHTHKNQELLDNITLDPYGNVTYMGKTQELPDNIMYTNIYDLDNDGVIDRALYSDSTNWENIINKPLFYMPSPHQHKIADIDGTINADTLKGITIDQLMKKNDKISISQITNINDIKVHISKIYGGNANTDFDGDLTYEETEIIQRYDTPLVLRNISPVLNNMEKCYETETNRYKIGNGINAWNELPYEYNTPESVRFNTNARKFISNYYNYKAPEEINIQTTNTSVLNPGGVALYSDTVRAFNSALIGVPYNATNILIADSNGENLVEFGNALVAINTRGAAWFSGVTSGRFVYCSPYNNNRVLKINSYEKNFELIESPLMLDNGKNAKYTRGTLSTLNDMVYFAPHNSDSIMEINPIDDTIKYYSNKTIFDNDCNCCDVVENPIDNLLYFIPKKGNKIVQFNPVTKFMKVVATINDYGLNKYSVAKLAPNGLIYCIPSYGYDYLMVFDPNTYDVRYIDFETTSYDSYNNAVVAPNSKIYLIPSGSNKNVVEFDLRHHTFKNVFSTPTTTERWCGGVLSTAGHIICLPYTTSKILDIDLKIKNTMSYDLITKYFK